jgi:cytochrome P450
VIDGFHIPAGKMVAVMLYTIQRHPEFWQAPDTFDPDRFAPEQSEKRHPMAWIPFGVGPRFCMGRDFAIMEGTLILAMLIQRFNMARPAGFVTKPRLAFTLRTNNGVMVNLTPR